MSMYHSLGVMGFGVMGASLAALYRHHNAVERLFAIDPNADHLAYGIEKRWIDAGYSSLGECSERPDVMIVATPISDTSQHIQLVSNAFNHSMVISDIASVKQPIITSVGTLRESHVYIPGHPMAGKETHGAMAADHTMFHRAPYILVPQEGPAYERFSSFLQILGFQVREMSAISHDSVVALVSHLPYLLASTVLGIAAKSTVSIDELKTIFGPGFRDTTRVAGTSSEWGADVCMSNAAQISDGLDSAIHILSNLREEIHSGNRAKLIAWLEQCRHIRSEMLD